MLDHNPMVNCTVGERYEAVVPDTLDLAERMGMAINALTQVWDPQERWSLAFNVDFSQRPPVLSTNHLTDAYLNIPAKFLEALTVCRLASGSAERIDVDAGVIQAQLSLVGEDGLTYCPTDTLQKLHEQPPFSEIWGEGRLLLALATLAQVDDDRRWSDLGRRKVDRLLALSSLQDRFRFFWKGRFRPGEQVPADAAEPSGGRSDGSLLDRYADPRMSIIYSIGALGHGAGLFYRATGYEPALELSGGLARWALRRIFTDAEGRWDIYHFHHSLYALMAVCEYGYASHDRAILERVDACYRWAREMGDPLIGFYAECMPGSPCYLERRGNTVEICEVADMVFLALYLTRAGLGDYWDDVDRWVRNLYAEGQLCDPEAIDRLPDALLADQPRSGPYLDQDRVTARSVGSFFGWMRANDGLEVKQTEQGPKLSSRGIMHCCTANGARTLYHVWDSIVGRSGEEVQVNLLLNRASPWLDVTSYLPVTGRVDLQIKDAPQLSVRMPEWCDPAQVAVSIDGQPCRAMIDGRRVRVGLLKPGSLVQLTFPVPERTLHRVIGEIPYRLVLRGANVVSIDPPGMAYPLFAQIPTGATSLKSRFVPERHVLW